MGQYLFQFPQLCVNLTKKINQGSINLTRSSPRHPYSGDEYASIHSDMRDVLLVQVKYDFKLKFQTEINGISTEI